jgi:hypothetical protein
MTNQQLERDFPPGHPAASDYDPTSAEAKEWVRVNVSPLGERDFPVDHPKALDTPGNLNHLTFRAGTDPHNPHREEFTGRTPEQAAGVAAMSAMASAAAAESPVTVPLDAAEVNQALDAKRHELGRDLLTAAEYAAVVQAVQLRPRDPLSAEDIRVRIERQHQALQRLMERGYNRNTAMDIIAREGAAAIL